MRHPSRVHLIIIFIVSAPLLASAQGTIEGTVTFWGDPAGGTEVEIAAHSGPSGPPDASVIVSLPSSPFSLPVADGTYFVAALMAADGNFGEPRPDDVLVWYDADGDGFRDTVTVSGGTVTGVDIDLGYVYVDIDATGANNGTSWTDALTDLQDGIDLAVSGVEVWVAEGTYVPGANRSDSFITKRGVRLYGGFTGTELFRDDRHAIDHPTILSGEIGTTAASDNCFHVVRAGSSNTSAMISGFTITRGYANGGGNDNHGGGVLSVGGGITLVKVWITDNYAQGYGAGVYTDNPGVVDAVNCSFFDNQAVQHGGGLYIDAGAGIPSRVVNGLFTGNSAWRGGGIAVEGQIFAPTLEPVLVNLSLSGNSAGGDGGGIFTNTTTFNPPGGAPVKIENTVLWSNSAPNPALSEISAFGGSDPPVVNHSLVEDGWTGPGTHILDVDPSFADAELRLNLDSPAIDAGDSTALPLDFADLDEDHWTDEVLGDDLDHYRRTTNLPSVPDTGVPNGDGETVDMGAYEAWDPALIFWDGFESGTLDAWSNVAGG